MVSSRSTRHRLLVTLLVLATVLGLSAAPSSAQVDPVPADPVPAGTLSADESRPDSRIVGGTEAPPGAWPTQVGLLFSNNPQNSQAQFCGGTLIARSWVLTAGHCVRDTGFNPTPNDIDILLGTQDLQSGGTRIRAVEFRINPGWNPSIGRSDIALIRLDRPAPSTIVPWAFTNQNVSPAAGTPVTAAGWGTTQFDTDNYPTKLRQVTVNVSTPQQCQSGYGSFYQQSTMVCAAAPGKDSCQGDSGGPLWENRSGTWVQVGVVSTGNGCASPGFPGVYTRIAGFSDWIKQQVRFGPHPNGSSFANRMFLDAYNRSATASEVSSANANFANGQAAETYANNILNQATYQSRTGGVIRLYQAIYLRKPDTGGMAYWWGQVNRPVGLKRIADIMVANQEFRNRYGDLDNTEFVEVVYQNVLDRAPSTTDRNYWVAELNSGRRSRGQVMVGFSESAEYRNKTAAGTKVIGAWFALLRVVPSDGDITTWGSQSSQALVTQLIRSHAYANRF